MHARPAGHLTQPSALLGAYVPLEHWLQPASPCLEKVPTPQSATTDELEHDWPEGHGVQLADPALAYAPVEHDEHDMTPSGDAVPARHCDEDVAVHDCPAGQGLHICWFGKFWYEPEGHATQSVMFVAPITFK